MNNATVTTAIAALAASTGLLTAAPADADAASPQPPSPHSLGSPAQVGDGTWTVTGLKPSSDTLAYHPTGTLWEATATNEATQGPSTPIVSNFNARAHSGQTYRELFQVATAQGVNPAGIAAGQKVSGKLYFDVTGDTPDSVTYNAGGPDLALWVQPPPSAATTGGTSGHASTPAGPATAGTTPGGPQTALPAGNPAGGSAGTVIPGTAQGTPLPAGVPGPQSPAAGTPAPAPAAGTPLPAPGAPAPTPAGERPLPAAATPTPAPGAPSPSPAPGAPQPTPAPAAAGTPIQPGTEQSPPSPVVAPPAAAPAANTQQ